MQTLRLLNTLLETERVIVRPITGDDFSALREMDTDTRGLKFLNGGREKSVEETTKLLQTMQSLYRTKNIGFYAWINKSNGDFIGWGGFKPIDNFDRIELGYRLRSKYWGQRYASEVTRALIPFGQNELNLEKIYGRVHPENKASVNILKSLGMKYLQMTRFRGFDVILYVLEK